MEIDITEIFNAFQRNADIPEQYQNSIANSGLQNIGEITWNNALKAPYQIVTPDNRADVIDYFKAFGAWEDLPTWTDNQLNALLIQEITDCYTDFKMCGYYWPEYEEQAQAGRVSGRIFKGVDGKIYFECSN